MDNMDEPLQITTTELRRALQREEFKLYYQPKMNLATGNITGVEALIRWNHPKKGLLLPAQFLSIAEKNDLMFQIAAWVLRTACTQGRAWLDDGLPPMIMAVNLSSSQFYEPYFVEGIDRVLKQTGFPAEWLEIEITEDTVVDVDHILPILRALKAIGVRISLDDFGIGYSSLFLFKKLPIDIIKIDQSFVEHCLTDLKDATIVKAIIAMAHELNVEVVAEGVESKGQLVFLQQNFCDLAQGYLFSEPLPSTEVAQKFLEIRHIITRDGIPPTVREQKWLKEALQKAKQELTDTMRYQQGMTFKFEKKDGKFVYTLCEGELVYRIGFTPEQIVGKELHKILPYDDVERKMQYYERAWSGEDNVLYEGQINGIWYLASLRPIRRGEKIIEVIGSCVDITERKEAKQKLRKSEQKYRLIAENMQDLIGILDTNGIVLYISPSIKPVLGFSMDEFEGISVFEFVHPEDIVYARKEFSDVINFKSTCRVELRYKHACNRWIDVEARCFPVLTPSEEVEHVLVVARDVTERKQSEEFIRSSENLRIAGQLAAGVAHEIRNPLTAIRGFAQLLHHGVDNPEYVEMMLSEISRLDDIVREFLVLARPHLHKMEYVEARVLLQQVILLFHAELILRNIEIAEYYDPNVFRLYCDKNQIKQVLINILQNAIDAMTKGGTISVELLQHDESSLKFRIIDEGIGISKDRMKHIGEPFYSSREKGTGLGLMISQKIVQEHGGMLHISSTPEQGTKVDVVLPIEPSEDQTKNE